MIDAGKRLEQPDNCPPLVYDLMLKCWSYTATSRPTFNQLYIAMKTELDMMGASNDLSIIENISK